MSRAWPERSVFARKLTICPFVKSRSRNSSTLIAYSRDLSLLIFNTHQRTPAMEYENDERGYDGTSMTSLTARLPC